ncbi:MMPL family transporter [Kribbella sp. CA-253562]
MIVCVGVLLDTLLVRTVVVPALAFLLGDRFWWPARVRAR